MGRRASWSSSTCGSSGSGLSGARTRSRRARSRSMLPRGAASPPPRTGISSCGTSHQQPHVHVAEVATLCDNPEVATLCDNPAASTLCRRGRNPVCPGGISRNLVPPTRRARAATSSRPPSRCRSCWALGPGRTSRTRCCTPSPGCKSAAPTGWRSSSRTAPTGLSAPAPTARAACGTFVEVTHTDSCDSAQRSVSDYQSINGQVDIIACTRL